MNWNTQADGEGTTFTAKTPVPVSITVYARWSDTEGYTVTFNKNTTDANSTDADPVSIMVFSPATTVKEQVAPDVWAQTPPMREGYLFNGWTLTEAGGADDEGFDPALTEIYEDMIVYAQWKESTVTSAWKTVYFSMPPDSVGKANTLHFFVGGHVIDPDGGGITNLGYGGKLNIQKIFTNTTRSETGATMVVDLTDSKISDHPYLYRMSGGAVGAGTAAGKLEIGSGAGGNRTAIWVLEVLNSVMSGTTTAKDDPLPSPFTGDTIGFVVGEDDEPGDIRFQIGIGPDSNPFVNLTNAGAQSDTDAHDAWYFRNLTEAE